MNTIMQSNSKQAAAFTQFNRSFRWTLAGSVTYEVIKIVHCYMLLKTLPEAQYGIMGSIFSLVYLTTYIADFGATNSLPAFLHEATKSKEACKTFLFKYSLFPHLPIVLVAGMIAGLMATTKLNSPVHYYIIPLLIAAETVRSFLRLFLHTTFQAKATVTTELIVFFAYMIAIWGPRITNNSPLEVNYIFAVHLADSIVSVIVFVIIVSFFLKKLPKIEKDKQGNDFYKRIVATRMFNYLLRLTRSLFTSNFLTPLFAIKFGLASAGMFYFASMATNTIQAIIKSVIGYSGNALLANLKNSTNEEKRRAFNLVCQRFMYVFCPILIFCITNYKTIIYMNNATSNAKNILSLSVMYMLISQSEFFFMLYEQFYVVEEAANKLFFFKIIELAVCYTLIQSNIITSPLATLSGIIIIRIISFFIIAVNAYSLWQIKPELKISRKFIITCTVVCLMIAAALQRVL